MLVSSGRLRSSLCRLERTRMTVPSFSVGSTRMFANQAPIAKQSTPLTPEEIQKLSTAWSHVRTVREKEKRAAAQVSIRLTNKVGKLAQSWFDIAYQKGEAGVTSAEKDLKNLSAVFQKQRGVEPIMQNEKFQREKLHDFGQKMKFSEGTVRFLDSLVQTRQMRQLKHVMTDFGAILKSYGKQVDAKLTVAKELTPEQLNNYVTQIRDKYLHLKPDEKLQLTVKVDPSIRGGFEMYSRGIYVDMGLNRRVMALIKTMRDDEIASFFNPGHAAKKRRDQNVALADKISAHFRRLAAPH